MIQLQNSTGRRSREPITVGAKINDLSEYFKVINDNLEKITSQNHRIQLTLMEVLKTTEVNALANANIPLSSEEQILLGDLQKMEEEINRPNQYIAQLNTLSLKAKQKKDSKEIPIYFDIDQDVLAKAEAVLKTDHHAIDSLVKITKKIEHSLQIIEEKIHNE